MKVLNILIIGCVILFGLNSCGKSANGVSRIEVRLVDAPGDYEEVNVDIQEFWVNYSNNTNNGWQQLPLSNTGVVDLLDLTGGVDLLLVNQELPAGELKQIRLVLGENNTVVVDGIALDLSTPSAQQSGLKIKVNYDLLDGITYRIILDFDADKSVVKAGNSGKYNLKPVIRAVADAQSGAIEGTVAPNDVAVLILAFEANSTDTLSTYMNSNGSFLLQGVPEGSYTVQVIPDALSTYQEVTINSVSVVNGQISDVGIVDID